MTPAVKQVRLVDYITGSTNVPLRKTAFASSKAYKKILGEIREYTLERSKGGSILVSGHRGSGKTTLIRTAITNLTDILSNEQRPYKPLLVALHGPDLLDTDRSDEVRAQPESTPQINKPIEPAKEENRLIKNVLEHLTISLYRALANEFFYSFQKKVNEGPRAEELKELIGLLRLELDDGTDVSVLRSIWDEAGFLQSGMTFPGRSKDQGVLEIVLLSSVAQAYRIVTGTITNKQTSSADTEREQVSSTEYKVQSKDIINAIFGLAAGVAVGAGVNELIESKYDLLIGGISGIITAFLSNYTFNYTSKTTTKKNRSRQYEFIKKTDISSLNRDLPNLIKRMRDIGIAPIFVVDELDKVIPPYLSFGKLISYLKNLVTDHSFFCFLTDRDYYDFMNSVYLESKYPVEYTYFSNRFYLNYSPGDLHAYLDELFDLHSIPDVNDKTDAILLQYMLLSRATLHTIDLRRELLKRSEEGAITVEGIRSKLYFRFPIMMQLAIESILQETELVERFEQDSYFFQAIVDTLYYPMRVWFAGKDELDITRGEFIKYLKGRSEFYSNNQKLSNNNGSTNGEDEIEDIDFLLEKLNQLVYIILKPDDLYNKLSFPVNAVQSPSYRPYATNPSPQSQPVSTLPYDPDITQIILNTIPAQPNNILLRPKGQYLYEWRFDYYGRALYRKAENKNIEARITLVTQIEQTIRKQTENEIGLATLAECSIINTSPSWYDYSGSINRLQIYISSNQEYPDLVYDQQIVDEYYDMILPAGKSLAKSIILAQAIKKFINAKNWKPAVEAAGSLLDWRSESGDVLITKLLHTFTVFEIKYDKYDINPADMSSWIQTFQSISQERYHLDRTRDDVRQEWWKLWKQRLIDNIRSNQAGFEATDRGSYLHC